MPVPRALQRLLPTLLAAIFVVLLAPATSRAGTYDVWSCRTPNGLDASLSGWTGTSNEAGGGYVRNECLTQGRIAAFFSTAPTGPHQALWQFDAPVNTRIVAYDLYRDASSTTAPDGMKGYILFEDEMAFDRQHIVEMCLVNASCMQLGDPDHPFAAENRVLRTGRSARHLYGVVRCFSFTFCGATSLPSGYAIYQAQITLSDDVDPSVGPLDGDLLHRYTPIGGAGTVGLSASDLGGGVERADLLVDGAVVASAGMEGRAAGCRRPFVAVVPCPLATSIELPLDTTRLADGVHRVQALVTDAGGNVARSPATLVTTKNSWPPVLPTASAPALPNGSSPDRGARLSVSFRAQRVRTVPFGHSAPAMGRLVTSAGRPIVAASLGVYSRVEQTGARWRGVAILRTGPRGGFRYQPRRGASRAFRFVYRAYSSDPRPSAARILGLRVRAGIRLSVTPRVLRNGRTAAFRVRLLGGPGRRGTLVSVQVLRPQRTTFATRGAGHNGIATVRHHFRYTYRPTTYLFRAVVQPQRGYPYAGAASGVVRLRVSP